MARRVNDPTKPKGASGERPFQLLSDDGRHLVGIHGSKLTGQSGGSDVQTVKLPRRCVEVVEWLDEASDGKLKSHGVIAYSASHDTYEYTWS